MTASQVYAALFFAGLVWFLWINRDKRTKAQRQADELKESLGYKVTR